jgi:tyrosine-protein kinase Etk/Wzc
MELKKYWEILVRRKWVVLLSIILLPLFAFLLFILTPTVYRSNAKLLIRTDNFKQLFVSDMPRNFGMFTYTDPDKIMNSIEEMMESTLVAGKVIQALDIRDRDGKLAKMGDFIDPSITTLIKSGKGVDIENVSVTEVFEIRGYSREPSRAKLITDGVASNFLAEFSREYRDAVAEVRKTMERRFAEVRASLDEAEKAVSEFKSENRLYNTSSHIDALIADLNTLESRSLALDIDLARLMVEVTPENPEVVKMAASKAVLEQQIREKQEILQGIPEKERMLNDLSHRVNSIKAVYNSMMLDLETAKSAEAMDLSNAVLIQPATEAKRYFPPAGEDYAPYIIMLAVIGLLAGVVLAFMFDFLDGNFKTPEEIEETLNHKAVVMLPRVKPSELGIVKGGASPFADSIYNLFSHLYIEKKEQEAIRAVSFAGMTSGAGISTMAAYSAYSLGQWGKRVLLIDGNLRNSSIHSMFGISADRGLSDYLSGDLGAQDIVKKTSMDNLDLITAGSTLMEAPLKGLHSDKLMSLVSDLNGKYDLILLDTPPFSAGSDTLLLSALVQKAVLVVQLGKTPKKAAQAFVGALARAGVEVFGVFVR